MGKVKVSAFSISLDGFGAGPRQSLENPLGERGTELHQWVFGTQFFRKTHGGEGGSTGIDNSFAERSFENVGAWIIGRNMFGPVRGPWTDLTWQGWWGEEPPYRVPVYVLTHHERPILSMKGGTDFHFITGGPEVALELARKAAGSRDIRIGGGVATVKQYLHLNAIDEMHLAQSPVLLGEGESFFDGVNLASVGFKVSERVPTDLATHFVLKRG